MPHLTLKHSKNLEKDFCNFFFEAHELITKTLSVKINSCRSLATTYEQYFIGTGDINTTFIHLDILIKSGYNAETLQSLGKQILELLKYHLNDSSSTFTIKASVELLEVGCYYFS